MTTWVLIVLIVVIGAGVVLVVAIAGTKANHVHDNTDTSGEAVVRCSEGHLFTTLRVPGALFPAVRIGSRRHQRCPVCGKWRTVVPVPDSELTDEDRQEASEHRDAPLL